LVWGSLSDVLGRKLQIVTGTLICAVSAALIGALPTGAWILLALLRILVGFGLAAAVTPCLTTVVELTPTRWRTGMTKRMAGAIDEMGEAEPAQAQANANAVLGTR
jgi:MFS transporter, putative metabolite:H+ symporter